MVGRKYLSFLGMLFLTGCFPSNQNPDLVTTLTPLKTILQEITGDQIKIQALVPAGASPHTFEPRPSDLRAVEKAKAFFYISELLDGWAASLPAQKKFEVIGYLPESFQLPALNDGHEHFENDAVDPHFWVDPLSVQSITGSLTKDLCTLFPNDCEKFGENKKRFETSLTQLHHEVQATLLKHQGKSVLLTHNFLNYYLLRYGISVAGIVHPSPGKETTPKGLGDLIALARKQNVKAILTTPQDSQRASQALAESVGIPVIVIDAVEGAGPDQKYEDLIRTITKAIDEGL